jgi:hypothetical protein
VRIRGTQETVKPIEVNVDTVYIRTNITKIEEEDFNGWEYDEVQYDKNEFIETLTRQEDSGMLALMVSMLMSEVDMLKSMIGGN